MKKQIFKKGSDSSSELSVNENSEQESNSFIIQRKKKIKKCSFKQKYLETSPNKRFGRYEEKKFSEINHTAYLGIDHDRGCDVLWNVINVSCLNIENKQILLSEFKKFKNLHHENVSALIDFWEKDQNSIIFITDYFTSGSIRQYLMKIGKQKLKVVKSWLKMILYGLEYLHKQDIVLKNLNCGRIFYNGNNGIVSIGEIYMASKIYQMIFYDNVNSNLDSEKFMINCLAPEILNKSAITEKSDLYSLGMVLIEMLSLEIPFNDVHSQITIREKIIDGYKPITIEKINDENIRKFLEKLLENDPKLRPSIHDLFNDEFIKINEKEDNRVVPIVKLKKKNKRQSMYKLSGNLNNVCNNINNLHYTTTPYHSNVPEDYVNSTNKITTDKHNPNLNLNKKFSQNAFYYNFNNQNQNLEYKNYNNSGLFQNNYFSNNINNTSQNYNGNMNNTTNNIHDNSHENNNRRGLHNMSKKFNKKKLVLFKHDFEENPYFEESLRMKIENEIENSKQNVNHTINNNIFGKNNNTDYNNNIFDIGNITPLARINNDPNYFLNQNNINCQFNEYGHKINNNKPKTTSSVELDEEYDNYVDNNIKNYYDINNLNSNNIELLSSIDNKYTNNFIDNKCMNNISKNKSNYDQMMQNSKFLSDFNQTNPDNISSVNCNYNKENLYNSSHANTNRNSNNTISCIVGESNLNGKSQISNVNNSSENQLNCINLTPKSIENNENIFSENNPFNANKENNQHKNGQNNKINDNEKDDNLLRKKKNKSVSWFNFDKNINKIDNCIEKDPNLVNRNKSENINDNNIDRYVNQKIIKDDKNIINYSSSNLNQIIEKKTSQNVQSNLNINNFSNEIKNDFENLKYSNDIYSIRENHNLNESNSNINNGFLKYSRDSSSMIESDHLLENHLNNKVIVDNYANFSSEINNNISEKDYNNLLISNKTNLPSKDKIENKNHPMDEKNQKSNYYDNNIQKEIQEQKQFKKNDSDIIMQKYNIDNDLNKDPGNKIKNKKDSSNKKIENNNYRNYTIENSSSDSLLHLNGFDSKDIKNQEEEYAQLENKNVHHEIEQNNLNENNNCVCEDLNMNIYNKPKFQIFDANYDVHLKFMINQDSKIHEIQFTYNLVKDNISDLMNEIQNEFNFSSENLNHIYETLKKISIYSKFYGNSEVLHDNSF